MQRREPGQGEGSFQRLLGSVRRLFPSAFRKTGPVTSQTTPVTPNKLASDSALDCLVVAPSSTIEEDNGNSSPLADPPTADVAPHGTPVKLPISKESSEESSICSEIIVHGKRRGKACGQYLPCRYHSRKKAHSPMRRAELARSTPSPRGPIAALAETAEITTLRKTKVTVRLVASGAQQQMRTFLDECLRDRSVRKRAMPQLLETYGEGCYYLRHTAARTASLNSSSAKTLKIDVDHTFECQLMAHAVVQCPDYAEILRQYDTTTRHNLISQQGFVVQGALRPVYDIQNNISDSELFNLRLLNSTINTSKRFAFTNFLKHVYDVRRGDYDLRVDMERLLKKHTSEDNAELITKSLLQELSSVEDPFVTRLGQGLAPLNGARHKMVSDRSRLEQRLLALSETVKIVFEDLCQL